MHTAKHDPIAAKYEYPSSRYMTVGGTRIHYCVEGRGPVLVLLHGLVGSLHTWDGWVKQLASHYRIVRIDLPGFGLSERLPSDDYTPEHAVELLEQVLAQLHVERCHLAGNSLGAFFAWYYAAHHPLRVERLILIDPIGYPQTLPPLASLLALPVVGELALSAPRALVARQLQHLYGDPTRLSDEVVTRYHALLARGKNRGAMVRTFRRLRAYKNDRELSREIPLVRAPTLLMWGGRDPWVPATLLSTWRRDLPAAEVKLYPDAGHMPMEELPEQTARDADAFLAGHEDREEEDTGVRSREQPVVPFVFARGA